MSEEGPKDIREALRTGAEDLQPWRENPLDSLVLGVATSIWAAEKFLRREENGKRVNL